MTEAGVNKAVGDDSSNPSVTRSVPCLAVTTYKVLFYSHLTAYLSKYSLLQQEERRVDADAKLRESKFGLQMSHMYNIYTYISYIFTYYIYIQCSLYIEYIYSSVYKLLYRNFKYIEGILFF